MKFGLQAFVSYFLVLLCAFASVSEAFPVPTSQKDTNFLGWVTNKLGVGLVKKINVFVTLESLQTNVVETNFDVYNPLIFDLTIDRILTKAGLNGTIQTTFDQTFPLKDELFMIKSRSTANSGTFGNVTLTQGAAAALAIVPVQKLDIIEADISLRVFTWLKGGFQVTLKGVSQMNIDTAYSIGN